VDGFLPGEDCLASIECLRALGVNIERFGQKVVVEGKGLHGFRQPEEALYAGNSGTTVRILSGVLAAQSFITVIDGDASIRRRPMKRVIQPLRRMGALIFCAPGCKAPLVFRPPEHGALSGGRHDLAVASAQVKSALLLAGLYTKKPVTIKEPSLSRDHTERMLRAFGVNLVENEDKSITMPTGQRLKACRLSVPGDISSAAFVLAAAAICPGSCVTVKNVGLNPTRAGILEILKGMGADLAVDEKPGGGAEPAGDITLRYRPLKAGAAIAGGIIPRLIDELPIIAVVAATAAGTTVIKDARELRVKESDRLSLMAKALTAFGVKVTETEDGMEITGGAGPFAAPGHLDAQGDHRMAMSMAIAGLRADGETRFAGEDCIAVSFPGFTGLMNGLGAAMEEGE
jgi:3-phosphoshikimate 1-carboxyvinyltransferase